VNRSSALGKFAPLATIAVVQLLVILLVPSVGRTNNGGFNNAAGFGAPGAPGAPGTAAGVPGAPGSSAAGVPGSTGTVGGVPGAVGPVGGQVGGGSTGAAVPAGVSGQPPAVAGDTKHCVAGRQFDPGIDYFAPPCVAGVPGAAYANNGGATWQGVSKDTIEIVQYVPDYGAAVNTILKAQGLFYDANQAAVLDKTFEKFINDKYQLYGRKVHVDTFQGKCQTVPPDLKCLIPEMDEMVQKYHPYAVLFSTASICSKCFAELARLKVVTTGGSGFSDEFQRANAPYVYDVSMSSTRMANQFAEFWCKQMTSKGNSGRTAIFAGTQNAAQNFRTKPRQLGIISTNDPDNVATVKNVLYPALKRLCGDSTEGHEYFYAQDISTAQQQSQAGTAAMNTTQNPATSVVCFCDPVAPQFAYSAGAQNNYWPESILATNQSMDFDSSGQTYVDKNGDATLACPTPRNGCPFDNGMGLGSADAQVAPDKMAGVKIFKAYGEGAALPVQPPTADIFWDNFNLLASLIENTGPFLTPARMAAAAPALGSRGGGTTGYSLRRFSKDNYSWTQDTRVIYFNKHKPSPYNNANGNYIQIEGRRFEVGQFPTLKQPPAPPAEGRS
jgi:hypothetical protein